MLQTQLFKRNLYQVILYPSVALVVEGASSRHYLVA